MAITIPTLADRIPLGATLWAKNGSVAHSTYVVLSESSTKTVYVTEIIVSLASTALYDVYVIFHEDLSGTDLLLVDLQRNGTGFVHIQFVHPMELPQGSGLMATARARDSDDVATAIVYVEGFTRSIPCLS